MEMKTTKQIRKELAKLIEAKQKLCTTQQQKNKAVNDARAEINKKYGSNWRDFDKLKQMGKYEEPSIYDGHTWGEYWMD